MFYCTTNFKLDSLSHLFLTVFQYMKSATNGHKYFLVFVINEKGSLLPRFNNLNRFKHISRNLKRILKLFTWMDMFINTIF